MIYLKLEIKKKIIKKKNFINKKGLEIFFFLLTLFPLGLA